eukprot:1010649-Pelagomonas_calceolata.AAC.1
MTGQCTSIHVHAPPTCLVIGVVPVLVFVHVLDEHRIPASTCRNTCTQHAKCLEVCAGHKEELLGVVDREKESRLCASTGNMQAHAAYERVWVEISASTSIWTEFLVGQAEGEQGRSRWQEMKARVASEPQ